MAGYCLVYVLFCFCFYTQFFLHALGFQHALPALTEQYTRGCSFHREKKKASHVQRFAIYLD